MSAREHDAAREDVDEHDVQSPACDALIANLRTSGAPLHVYRASGGEVVVVADPTVGASLANWLSEVLIVAGCGVVARRSVVAGHGDVLRVDGAVAAAAADDEAAWDA